jgi:hypothetical protein
MRLRAAALTIARERAMLTVCAAVLLPLAFLILQRATIYDGSATSYSSYRCWR